ncbi:MAG TPA: hypothetical protein VF846_12980 [Thermoanaerobaculia bacterium]
MQSITRAGGATILLGTQDVVVHTRSGSTPIRISFPGGNGSVVPRGVEQVQRVTNYLASGPREWRTSVPNYAKILYSDVYPDIDVVFYGREGELEYDFVVGGNADPRLIRVAFDGHSSLRLNETGDLMIGTGTGELRQTKPVAYQVVNGRRKAVAAEYRLARNAEATIRLGAYDKSKPLIIDPVLTYSSYFGGAGDDHGNAIAVREVSATEQHVYLTGAISMLPIPGTTADGVAYESIQGQTKPDESTFVGKTAFVTKLIFSDTGVSVAFTSYLGTTSSQAGQSEANAIAITDAGEIVIIGTASGAIPVSAGAYQQSGERGGTDCFAAKLSSDGGSLMYSTLFGGTAADDCRGLALTSGGEAVIVGKTLPGTSGYSFPGTYVPGPPPQALLSTLSGVDRGGAEAFVVQLSADGQRLLYAHHLGGSDDDTANAVAIDRDDTIYIAGTTSRPVSRVRLRCSRVGMPEVLTRS